MSDYKILGLCEAIRESLKNSTILFTEGGCLHFHFILKSIFDVVPYYMLGHVVSYYNGRYYDITGDVTDWFESNLERNVEDYRLDVEDYLKRGPREIKLTGFCMIYNNEDYNTCREEL